MKEEMIKEIIKTAKSSKCTEIEIISAMQSECVKRDDVRTLDILINIKNDFIENINN